MGFRGLFRLLALVASLALALSALAEPTVDFNRDVRPILSGRWV